MDFGIRGLCLFMRGGRSCFVSIAAHEAILRQEEVRNEGIKQDVRCHAAAEPSTRHPESSLVLQTA